MTRDDIIRMAREAGFVIDEKAQQHQPNCVFHTYHMIDEPLGRFAALVAAHEREACAKVCDLLDEDEDFPIVIDSETARSIAAAIRERSEK